MVESGNHSSTAAGRTKDLRRSYLRYLKLERNYSANTIGAYVHDVDMFFTFLQTEGVAVEEACLEHMERFAATLHEQGMGPTSLARVLCGVRSLYRFMLLDGRITDDPTELLEGPVLAQHIPDVLSLEEIDRMEAAIDLSRPEGRRNRAIIETLFSCGLRVSELVTLRLSDLYLDEGFIRVRGKGSKERLVPISRTAVNELRLWFIDRNALAIKPGEQDYVFLNRRGSHLTRTMILIIIKRVAAEAGISKTVSPHTLRHSFATELHKGGADLRVIQEMLGHENISTTEIYTHTDTTALRREILLHHPRNIVRRDGTAPADGSDGPTAEPK